MNKWVGIGRLTAKPELNYTASQTAVTKFTVAVDRKGKEGADFIRVTAFGRQAENICRYMDKGRQIAIEGRLETGSYQKDGKTVYTQDVIIEGSDFLGGKAKEEPPQAPTRREQPETYYGFQSDLDDMPF